jgi:hypothetical protein
LRQKGRIGEDAREAEGEGDCKTENREAHSMQMAEWAWLKSILAVYVRLNLPLFGHRWGQ